jgi:hypothetical protein
MRAHISPLDVDTIISAEDLVPVENKQSFKFCSSIGKHLTKLNLIQKNLLPSHPWMVQNIFLELAFELLVVPDILVKCNRVPAQP